MEYKKLVAELRERGLSNGSTIGHHSGLYEVAADAIEELLARAEKAERERDAAVERVRSFMEKEKYIHIPVGTTSDGTVIERVIRK